LEAVCVSQFISLFPLLQMVGYFWQPNFAWGFPGHFLLLSVIIERRPLVCFAEIIGQMISVWNITGTGSIYTCLCYSSCACKRFDLIDRNTPLMYSDASWRVHTTRCRLHFRTILSMCYRHPHQMIKQNDGAFSALIWSSHRQFCGMILRFIVYHLQAYSGCF